MLVPPGGGVAAEQTPLEQVPLQTPHVPSVVPGAGLAALFGSGTQDEVPPESERVIPGAQGEALELPNMSPHPTAVPPEAQSTALVFAGSIHTPLEPQVPLAQ